MFRFNGNGIMKRNLLCVMILSTIIFKAMENSGLKLSLFFQGLAMMLWLCNNCLSIGMLFIKSDGLSHHPDESIIFSDVTKAIQVTESALTLYSEIFGESQ